MTIQEATYFLLNKLRSIYPKEEASGITDWVMEHITGSGKVERMLYKNEVISSKEELLLAEFTDRLMQHEPVQYILNEAWFYKLKFYVDKNVLIPRPETEELVKWIIKDAESRKLQALKILDIGTGSGCIPVSLKKKLDNVEVFGCDISETAIKAANKNASALDAAVNFFLMDFLDKSQWKSLPLFDVIVSNPPYVPEKDKEIMQPNVLHYEPGIALFVPDTDPLIFYKAIAEFGKTHLNINGAIYAEIHENLGKEVTQLFQSENYGIEIRKDMQGKQRMIKVSRIP